MSIVCQQCKEPLQLDASLIDLSPSAYDAIAANLPPASNARVTAELRQVAPHSPGSPGASWQRLNTANGLPGHRSPIGSYKTFATNFSPAQRIFLKGKSARPQSPSSQVPEPPEQSEETELPNPSPLSHRLRSTARLFNLLSSRTDIDHPLCAECTQTLLSTLQRQLDETKKERDGYLAYEKELRREKERENQGSSKEDAEKKIEKLKLEERQVVDQLKEAEREREQLEEELKQLELDEKALEAEEVEFWRAHNEQLLVSEQQVAQLASLRAAYATDAATLEKLERTNVYNDAFCIGHDGVFGTINGLRLGRVAGVQVEYAEINAAWGQMLLLLYTIARKLEFTFEQYRLIPMGSFSRIEKTTGDKATYELYGSGDLHLGRLFHNRRFDLAMVAFLDCLKQLMDYIKSQDSGVDFPHQISRDKIGDVSIKLQFNQEESWTRALRHVLLALKICLKWATSGMNG
ncbi:beclin 1 protein [Amanita rubescens]|nr:beclin 1 protein [Amanita rubescens]